MKNIQIHFAKYLEKNIWDELKQRKVLLVGVRKNYLIYVNGSRKEKEGDYNRFRILVKSCSSR